MQVDDEAEPSPETLLEEARATLAGLDSGGIHLPDSLCQSEEALWDTSCCVRTMFLTSHKVRAHHRKKLLAVLGTLDQLRAWQQ